MKTNEIDRVTFAFILILVGMYNTQCAYYNFLKKILTCPMLQYV